VKASSRSWQDSSFKYMEYALLKALSFFAVGLILPAFYLSQDEGSKDFRDELMTLGFSFVYVVVVVVFFFYVLP